MRNLRNCTTETRRRRWIAVIVMLAAGAFAAATTNYVVQISTDGTTTIPPNTIATPEQVTVAASAASNAKSTADEALAAALECSGSVGLYSTNYVVTSTVYVQSIGGVPYDASNQVINVQSISVTPEDISIVATVRQTPLVPPALDWRAALGGGAWTNITASVQATDIPQGVTNAAAAYLFTLDRPDGGSAFFRVVDNSTGASGSGLWWVVFGGITVDGHLGATCAVTNGADVLNFVGGILVEPEPLGGQ
jgi:hypothetical protein